MPRWVFTSEDGIIVDEAVMDRIMQALQEYGEPYKDVYISVPVRARARIQEWYAEIVAEGIWDVRVNLFKTQDGEDVVVVEGLQFKPKELVEFVP